MTTQLSRVRRKTDSHFGQNLQAGFSLIELMVAMVISLLIMGAILTLFLDVTRTNDEMAKTNAQIENGRFAVQLIANDLAHGGFWDGYVPQFDDLASKDVPGDYPAAVPAPCLDFASWDAAYRNSLLAIPVQVYDAVPAGCEAVIQNKKAGTDVLVVRHADTCLPGAGNCEADTSGGATPKVYFQPSLCANVSPYTYVLGTSGFTLQKRSCLAGSPADKRKYVSNIYFIRNDNTLMRAEFGGGGGTAWSVQPLIDGVEGLAVELGVDDISDSNAAVDYTEAVAWADALNKTSPTNRGDGTPDGAFVRCTTASACTVAQLANVVAAKLYLLVRSTEETSGYTDTKTYTLGSTNVPAFNDGFKRHVFSTTVRLINVSGRRETP